MISCLICGKKTAARAVGACADCLRLFPQNRVVPSSHSTSREKFGLPPSPPRHNTGLLCPLCANQCRLNEGDKGYCGLRRNEGGKIRTLTSARTALAHIYLDPLPTNCCAAWFCEGSRERGYNLAVFFYGCSFDCLFCQNHSHKHLAGAPILTEDKLVAAALLPEVRCVCFFGGSPEPQLPFAIRASRRILKESKKKKHICWEWNGCGHPSLAKKAAEIAAETRGTVKFDLKAFDPYIAQALCGTSNQRAFENFAELAKLFPRRDMLTATTLLVPFYVDGREVKEIARFISEQDADIPYSLLVFHPDYLLTDLPTTPRVQVEESFSEAKRYLRRVNVGNLHLL